MEPSKTISLLANVSRFVILTFAAAIVLPPALPSQTARELIAEACYNELQHRETKTLWSYTAQRRVDNHIFLERVIETVDGPVRHLLAADGYPPTPAQIRTSASSHFGSVMMYRLPICHPQGFIPLTRRMLPLTP